jgi:uncharacterized damage-inducible protein DinB
MDNWLLQGFDYDRWANDHWIETLPNLTSVDRARTVMDHILGAGESWADRCGFPLSPVDREDLRERARRNAEEWKRALTERDVHSSFSYLNRQGEPNVRTLEEIARHVVNHGTYHRGHLRQIAETDGIRDWPDTDVIYFFDAVRRKGLV